VDEGEPFASRRLQYVPITPPAPGTCVTVAPQVRWTRLPMPMELNHINVWLIELADGCVIVDTGLNVQMAKDAWLALEQELFSSLPVRAVVVTHIHPDHIGLAAWLEARYDVPVHLSPRTYELARSMVTGENQPSPAEVETFVRSHGLTDLSTIRPALDRSRLARTLSGLPHVERFLEDEKPLPAGLEAWTAMQTEGHAEGHLCLRNEAARVLISGDQVLPTISPNISFGPHTLDTNPLGSYLLSLERLHALPADTLVLPSHGLPFQGLHRRLEDLQRHHEEQLAAVTKLCVEPRTAGELLPLLFRRELKGVHLFLALGEAVAHLEYLVHAGRLERDVKDTLVRYVAVR
jgi:glyoxylase-like metal-dependent hydrolase (beta-lactamase superfamily II)